MDKLKKILIDIAFLIPAILMFILVKADYDSDSGLEIGLTLWGTWTLLCGFYFKNSYSGTLRLTYDYLGFY